MEAFTFFLYPLAACVLLILIHAYFGVHILARGIIFVDLALAQTAAFGTCISLLAGYDVHDWQSYAFSLAFTFVALEKQDGPASGGRVALSWLELCFHGFNGRIKQGPIINR